MENLKFARNARKGDDVAGMRNSAMILTFILAAAAWAQQPADLKPTTDRIAASIYTGPAMGTLQELTDGIGGRVTGSPAYVKATEWAAAKFRAYGAEDVRLEPFSMDAGWQRGSASGEMLSPMSRPLYVASVGWAPSTPPGGVEGNVILINDISREKLEARAEELRGKIVLVDSAKIYAEGYADAAPKLEAMWPLLQSAGALAVMTEDRTPNNVHLARSSAWSSKLVLLPYVQLGMEDTKLVRRELEHGPVTVHLKVENKTSGPMTVNNVVAEIRGRERPDEWILIGAHLDSWDFGTGAQDNGTGAVTVLEVARAMVASGRPPRRSVRFALWGGEEQALLGSYAYTQMHKKELSKCVAVLNTDNGAGHPKGWKVEGRADLKQAMQPWSDSLLKEIGGGNLSTEATYDTDHGPFMLQGIPALDLWVDETKYEEVLHRPSDTFDKVDVLDFKAGAAIVAATAYAIADAEKPIASHLDHDAVGEILRNAKLEGMLEAIGIWKP
jgi:carboxypeptidase Q